MAAIRNVLNEKWFIMNIRTLICAAALALSAVSAGAVTVTSAGGSLAVPGLPVEIAEALKETVVARAGLDQGETHNGER